ncbi:hypothetical protein GCM10017083_47040 [Thalassobaculum fulvum]|uniref:Tetratricopeptide repeat protein n=1 Tax=Thalassobaculum fulvum TaxID=1633335 RepID=A0A918XXA6_9PROT|nr:tetratricopeptide repeat protein [Thalassobaculum fulvum]GHD60737.1 hypothetical protein GCM10017083_47040 [Thalassobaculum fulvum]
MQSTVSNHSLADVQALLRAGQFETARDRAAALIRTGGGPGDYLALAQALQHLGQRDEALNTLGIGLARWPGDRALALMRGHALMAAGRHDEAASAFERRLRDAPGDGDAMLAAAVARAQGADPGRSLPLFDTLLRAAPGRTDILYNKAIAQKAAGDLAGSEASYRTVVAQAPELHAAWRNLGNLLLDQGRLDEAAAAYHAGFLKRRARGANPGDPDLRVTSAAKLRHDLQQIEHLAERRLLAPADHGLIDAYRTVLAGVEAASSGGRAVLSDQQLARLGGSYQRILHVDPAPRITGPVINPDLDVAGITRRYFEGPAELAVVDDVLTPEALSALRRFMNDSSIWHKWRFSNDNGYVGAMLADGFFNPLLVQISEAVRAAFLDIFGPHRLQQTWAFKHSEHVEGVPIHADSAAVNVNLYTTPDDANLDPETGGIVVWDTAAPLDWDFAKINTDEDALLRHLESVGATAHRIPHRQNRIVIFDSDLVHRTDDLRFRPGYLNRRINVTMLYGRRTDTGH